MLRPFARNSTAPASGNEVGLDRPAHALRLMSCARREGEQIRLVERERLAATIDRDLRHACRAEAAARLTLGVHAGALLRRRSYYRLGFVRLADYARERLGISARALEDAALVAAGLARLPRIAAAFRAGGLSWTQARLLVGVADDANESWWLAVARERSVDGLMAAIRAQNGRACANDGSNDPEGDLIDGEPAGVLRVACPGRLRSVWRRACELASRVAGEPLPAWRAAEAVAAEGIAGRPAGVSVGDRVLLAFVRLRRRRERSLSSRADEGRRVAERAPADAPSIEDTRETIDAPPPTTDPFELDRRLGETLRTLRGIEPQIGRLLRVLVDHRLYRVLGFRALDDYVRERLRLSLRKAWALVKVERGIRRAAPFAEAYEQGRMSWVRALALLPVVERSNAEAWIVRAQAVTVRRLTDEVGWVLDRRDLLGPDTSLAPPPVDCRISALGAVQLGAHPTTPVPWTKNGTAPFEIADAEIRFVGPTSVVALFRDALDVCDVPGLPRWRALERLLTRVIADWEAEPSHRDPVFGRDGWRCTVPGCSSRRNLHDHHVRFRSHRGDNRRSNRTTVCAAHHLHGIHGGTIRVSGAAPALRWELPLFSCIGDRYV